MSHGREFFGPTKQEIQAGSPDESRHKGGKRKNTKDWCKGKKGRLHSPVIDVPTNAIFAKLGYECGWATHTYVFGEEGARYRCDHAEVCSVCGKILRYAPFFWGNDGKYSISVMECPNYTPEPSTP